MGLNLQDHFYVHGSYRSTPDSSYNLELGGIRKYLEGARYLLTRKGYLALGSSQVGAFVKSRPEEAYADLQISFRPMTFTYHPGGECEVDREPGMGVSVYLLRPRATGTVTLRSVESGRSAVFKPNFLTNDDDNQGDDRGREDDSPNHVDGADCIARHRRRDSRSAGRRRTSRFSTGWR